MLTSTRVILTYRALALTFFSLSITLAYLLWVHQPMPDTLEEIFRPIAIVCLLLFGFGQAISILLDPLARRVVRMLRRKSE